MTVETTRVGDGRSPRLGALAVVGVLVVVAWVGFSNRPPASPSATPALAAVGQPTPEREPSAEPTASGTPLPFATAPASSAHPPGERPPDAVGAGSGTRDYYVVQAAFELRTFTTLFTETAPGTFIAELSIPIPPPATRGELRLLGLQETAPGTTISIGAWPLLLESLNAASGREYVVLDRRVVARPRLLNQPLPVLRGYRLTAAAEGGLGTGLGTLTVEIEMGPNGRIIGDDGIFGWPTVAQLPRTPTLSRGLRERGAYNYCRWDIGVLAARPRFGNDESDCV